MTGIQKRWPGVVGLLVGLACWAAPAVAQNCGLGAGDRALFTAEHMYGGQPTPGAILVRRGYVAQYDPANRVPRWVAWRAIATYRNRVRRSGRFASFRVDPNIPDNPVRDRDYNGLHQGGVGFARGHMAPYFIAGGDRNRTGVRAPSDAFDACTVFEINYMTNVAPQLHNRFNGSGGLWYKLETLERQTILPRGQELHIIAGTIFGPNPRRVGPDADIGVPDMFYRVLVTSSGVVPFLFTHGQQVGATGCRLDAQLTDCIVTVADIERVAGVDLFSGLSDEEERALEASDGRAVWRSLVQ